MITTLCVRGSSGVNVLDGKSELRKELDKRKQRQQRRDDDQHQRQNERRSSFELRLEQQANKLDLVTVASNSTTAQTLLHVLRFAGARVLFLTGEGAVKLTRVTFRRSTNML